MTAILGALAANRAGTSPGGGGGGGVSVAIDPASVEDTTVFSTSSGTHTAIVSGGTPSAYLWAVESSDTNSAAVVSGGTSATATLQGGLGSNLFSCTVTVGGVAYKAFCTRTHSTKSGGGGGIIP